MKFSPSNAFQLDIVGIDQGFSTRGNLSPGDNFYQSSG